MQESTATPHYDFFVSGRWRNRDNVLGLAKGIRGKGYKVYCFLEEQHNVSRLKSDPEEEMKSFEARNWREDPYVKEIFDKDMRGERQSDALVMLLPIGKSGHIEAGVAYGLSKRCILIGEQKEAESLYLIFNEVYPTIEEFIESLHKKTD